MSSTRTPQARVRRAQARPHADGAARGRDQGAWPRRRRRSGGRRARCDGDARPEAGRGDRLDASPGALRLAAPQVIDRVRDAAGDVPVEHIVVDLSEEGEANVLVLANETVVGDPLLAKIKERAARSPATFLIICPQSDPSQGTHPEAERRLRRALTVLRGEGSRRTARLRTRTRTPRRSRPSTTSASTRSSSRRLRPSSPPG